MANALLHELYMAVSAQSKVTIDAKLPGCAALAAEIAAIYAGGIAVIATATTAAPDADGNFTLTGTSDLFGANIPVQASFFMTSNPDSVQVVLRASDKLSGGTLPAALQIPFLADASFSAAMLAFASSGISASQSTYAGDRDLAGHPLGAGFNIVATLLPAGAEWDVLRAILPELSELAVFGAITAAGGGPVLQLQHAIGGVSFSPTSALSLTLDSLGIACRVGNGVELPRLTLQGHTGGKLPLQLAVSMALGMDDAAVVGTFGDGQAVALSDIAGLVGLDSGLLKTALPPDYAESAFGTLALRELRLALAFAPLRVTTLDCILTAQKPWTLLSDRIWSGAAGLFSVTPILQFHAAEQDKVWTAGLDISGPFSIGATAFGLRASFPDGSIAAVMKNGDTLDVGALFASCLPGVPQIPIELSEFGFNADYASGSANLSIGATGAWSLDFGIATLTLLPATLVGTYQHGAISDWGFGGDIVFAGLAFHLTGEWQKDTGWALRGQRLDNDGLNIGSLFAQVLTEFTTLAGVSLPGDIPDALQTCAVNSIAFDYSEATKQFSIDADITNVLDFGAFAINEFAVTLIFAAGKPITGTALARLRLAGFELILQSAKASTGWSFSGGTPAGEAVDLSALLESLAAFAGVSFPLPAEHLQVTDLAVAFSESGDRTFAFSCAVQTAADQSVTGWGRMSGIARRRDDDTWDHLVNLAIEHGFAFPLHDLPVAGPHLGDLSVDSLGCTIASDAFSAAEVAARNKLLPDGAVHADEVDTAKGAIFVAVCHLGSGDAVRLTMPIGSDSAPANQPDMAVMATGPASPGAGDHTAWLDIHKTFSAVTFDRIGLRYAGGRVALLFDMALGLGPLQVALMGLGVSSPLDRFDPLPTLDGLGLDYSSGPVAISGGFLAMGDGSYAGFATVQTEAVSLSARGMYGTVDGHPSIFVYGLLDKPPLGGPPIFYVDGLAVGFGIDSRLDIPPIDSLAGFSLLQGVLPDTSPTGKPDDPADMLKSMTEIKPSLGANWLALGVRFNSFRIVESFALLTLQFGGQPELDLIGLSRASVPPMADTPIAAGELLLEASIDLSSGNLAVDGKLSPNSFVLSHDCHLIGGFAYRSWVSGAHAGDFVLTLGGYHPQFPLQKFPHYPSVERLGYVWSISSNLQVKGTSYFALTPNALMAGGSLDALWSSGDVHAWFDVDADFLMYWKPFHYIADASCSIGVSVRINLLFTSTTITISIGADVHFEGPPFGGYAHIDLWCVSFTVSFGDSQPPPAPIDWQTFKESFLLASAGSSPAMVALAADPTDPDAGLLTILPVGGLLRDRSKDPTLKADEPRWIFHPETIMLQTRSSVPATSAQVDLEGTKPDPWQGTPLAVGPSAIDAQHFSGSHVVTLARKNPGASGLNVAAAPVYGSVPSRLWSKQGDSNAQAAVALGDGGLMAGALTGVQLARKMLDPDHSCMIPISSLQYEVPTAENTFSFSFLSPAIPPLGQDAEQITPSDPDAHAPPVMAFTPPGGASVKNTNFVLSAILDSNAVAARTNTIEAMLKAGMTVSQSVVLDQFGASTELNDWPIVTPLGAQ